MIAPVRAAIFLSREKSTIEKPSTETTFHVAVMRTVDKADKFIAMMARL